MMKAIAVLMALCCTVGATAVPKSPAAVDRTAAYLETIRSDPNPARLTEFLAEIPKGGDLHHHLSGAVYAESYINYAAEDGDCFDATFTIVPPPCDAAKGSSPASRAQTDYAFRNLTIDALSARNFAPTTGDSSILVHFFKTFFKFDLVVNKHWGEELAEVVHRAAIQHEIYLETILGVDKGAAIDLGHKLVWSDDFDTMRAALDAAGMPRIVAGASRDLDSAERDMRRILRCGTAAPDPGCDVTLRYQHFVLRAFPKAEAFAQIQAGFEIANADPRVVSINPVQPQEDYIPLKDFELQLRMFAYFHKLYPKVHLSMHAGELFLGVAPPEEMYDTAHIRDTIDIGGAERIGHGLDVLSEPNPQGLLGEMARKHILVEDPIYIHELIGPGVIGSDVLLIYLHAGVPVALATDDEGGARSNMTQTFRRAVQGYNVDYYTLKAMVRDSLEHAFVPGPDLWVAPERFTAMTPACTGQPLVPVPATPACRAFLGASEKATLEWKEEVAFAKFESRF
jgi:adenosine deaminase